MEFVKLTDVELRFYNELFSLCDVENTGKVSGIRAAEMFRASQLSTETLQQITEICGAKRLGHFGRSQFYIAMKLISAAQMGLQLKLETINTGLELPLPKFTRINEDKIQLQKPFTQNTTNEIESVISDRFESGNQLHQSTPAVKNLTKNNVNNLKPLNIIVDADKITSPTSDSSQTTPFGNETFSSGETSSPRNTVEKEWSVYLNNKHSYSSDYDQWQQFEDERQLLTTEDDNSERHSSDDEYDVWSISNEQREYYINQFRLLQPDLGGLLSGAVAKEFFEKSKLPVIELSKIWQLSDVNKDGALCLEEFFTAMHLVVLRRNNVPLPDNLPAVLIPQINNLHCASEDTTKSIGSPDLSPPQPAYPVGKEDPKILHPVALRLSPEGQVMVEESGHYEILSEQQKGGSKRLVIASNSLSGNDDSLESSMAPPSQAVIQRPVAKKLSNVGIGAIPPPPASNFSANLNVQDDSDGNSLHLVSSFSGSSSASMPMAYSGGLNSSLGPKKDPPPPPPPRPKRNHARSSSLDLNRLGKGGFSGPPAVPPRVSPSMRLVSQKSESDAMTASAMLESHNLQNLTHSASSDETEINEDVPQTKSGAFEVYKRLSDDAAAGPSATVPESSTQQSNKSAIMKEDVMSHAEPSIEKDDNTVRTQITESESTRDKKELLAGISQQNERNSVLHRLNMELNQELTEVMEERIVLEIHLEHLKPFST